MHRLGLCSIAVDLGTENHSLPIPVEDAYYSATVSAMASRDLIDQAGKALAKAAGSDSKVILFGSHARGDERPDSDVDFLVIEPVVKNRLKEWERLRRILKDFPMPVDIVVLDEKRAERRAKVPGTMVHHALRDGRILAHS